MNSVSDGTEPISLPPCRHCGAPTGRWGWYEDPEHPVHYVICYECLNSGIEPAVQVVGRLVFEKNQVDK